MKNVQEEALTPPDILDDTLSLFSIPCEGTLTVEDLTGIEGYTGIVVLGIINNAPDLDVIGRVETLCDILSALDAEGKLGLVKFIEFSGAETGELGKIGISEAMRLAKFLTQKKLAEDQIKPIDMADEFYFVEEDQLIDYLSEVLGIEVFFNNEATSTQENFDNTGKLVDDKAVQNIVFISGSYRPSVPRALYSAANALYKSKPDLKLWPISGSRYDTRNETKDREGIGAVVAQNPLVEKILLGLTMFGVGKILNRISKNRVKSSKS